MYGYIKPTGSLWSNDIPKPVLKCKQCSNEFGVISFAGYTKMVCFSPFCGQRANPERKRRQE